MLKIASLRDDLMGRFHNSLFLGDVTERVHVLKDAGQLRLAYVTAKLHGLEEEEKKLESLLGADKIPKNIPAEWVSGASLMLPPNPILKQSNWPLLEVRKSFPETAELPEEPDNKQDVKAGGGDDGAGKAMIGDEDDDEPNGKSSSADPDVSGWGEAGADANKDNKAAGGGGWEDMLPMPVGDDKSAGDDEEGGTSGAGAGGKGGDYFLFPTEGKSAAFKWANNSPLPADMIAAGSFDLACGSLHRTIGVVNFAPLKPFFMAIYSSAHGAMPQLPGCDPLSIPALRSGASVDGKASDDSLPELVYKLANCVDTLKLAYEAVTKGAFSEAVAHFTRIVHTIPFLVVDKKAQAAEVAELLEICREYILAMRIEMTRKEEKDATRQAQLAAYFTRCKIQPTHTVLGLRVAIKCTYTAKNFKTCAALCQRVLELCLTNNKSNLAKTVDTAQIKQILKVCEKTPTDATDMKYSDTESFVLCAESFTPLTKSTPAVKCPYCQASYRTAAAGSLCRVCQLSKIDSEATGLLVFPH